MSSYILLISFCSLLSGNCTAEKQYPITFDTHYACLQRGYKVGLDMVNTMDIKKANKHKLYVTFTCKDGDIS